MSLYENIQFNEGTIALVYDTLNHCINEGMIKTGCASGWLLLNLRVIYFLAIYGSNENIHGGTGRPEALRSRAVVLLLCFCCHARFIVPHLIEHCVAVYPELSRRIALFYGW